MQKNNLTNRDLPLPIPTPRIDRTKHPEPSEPVHQWVEERAIGKPIGSEGAVRTGASHLHGCSCQHRTVPARWRLNDEK